LFDNKYEVRDASSYCIKVIALENKIPEESSKEIKTFYNKLRFLISILKESEKLKLSYDEFTKEIFETVVRFLYFFNIFIKRKMVLILVFLRCRKKLNTLMELYMLSKKFMKLNFY